MLVLHDFKTGAIAGGFIHFVPIEHSGNGKCRVFGNKAFIDYTLALCKAKNDGKILHVIQPLFSISKPCKIVMAIFDLHVQQQQLSTPNTDHSEALNAYFERQKNIRKLDNFFQK